MEYVVRTMRLKTNEKGFTLTELLVTISIVAIISGALAMAIITLMRLSPQSKDWNIALRQVQNAGYWISRDVQMSKGAIIVGTSDLFLRFTIPTGPNTSKTVEYRFVQMSGNLKRLIRVDGASTQQIMIAEHIYYNPSDPANSTRVVSYQSPKLVVKISAASGTITVSRQYEAIQRVPVAAQ